MTEFPLDLEAIAKEYGPAIDQIRGERTLLGLETPDDIEMRLFFSNYAAGLIKADPDSKAIYVNPIMNAEYHGSMGKEDAYQVCLFFDELRPFFGEERSFENESSVIKVITGEIDFDDFRKFYESEDEFLKNKNEFNQRRDMLIPFLRDNAALIQQAPHNRMVNTIAHEIDHLAFNSRNYDFCKRVFQSIDNLDFSNPQDIIETLEKNHDGHFAFLSSTEAKAHYFETFRQLGYDASKLDAVKKIVSGKMHDYVYTRFIDTYIQYVSLREGYESGIHDPKELFKLTAFIRTLFPVPYHPDHRRQVMENHNDQNPEVIGRVVLDVSKKLGEYWCRSREMIDQVHEEYRERMQKVDKELL